MAIPLQCGTQENHRSTSSRLNMYSYSFSQQHPAYTRRRNRTKTRRHYFYRKWNELSEKGLPGRALTGNGTTQHHLMAMNGSSQHSLAGPFWYDGMGEDIYMSLYGIDPVANNSFRTQNTSKQFLVMSVHTSWLGKATARWKVVKKIPYGLQSSWKAYSRANTVPS